MQKFLTTNRDSTQLCLISKRSDLLKRKNLYCCGKQEKSKGHIQYHSGMDTPAEAEAETQSLRARVAARRYRSMPVLPPERVKPQQNKL